jgi:multidrug efflux pump subunit AcrB
MAMVMLTAPLGLVGVVPALLAFNQPFGFNAILGLIGLAGILMRNTLILTEQIKENRAAGLEDYHAVIEATVQRTRPVILTAVAAVLAFVPLTGVRHRTGRKARFAARSENAMQRGLAAVRWWCATV